MATLGFWGVCWAITAVAARFEPWRCRECNRAQPDEADPLPSTAEALASGYRLVHEHID